MGASEQIRRPPPTAVDDAEAYLKALGDGWPAGPIPRALIGRLVAQVRNLERETQKLGARVAELECGRGM